MTAAEIFGLAQGAQVRLKRTMADMIFQFLASSTPDAASALKAIDGQTATVVTADDNEVTIQLDGPASLSAEDSAQAANRDNITMRLKRGEDGLFEFSIRGAGGNEKGRSLAYTGLSAEPASKGVRLAAEEPRLRIIPATEGVAQIEAYTAPFLENVPAGLRAFAPKVVELISLTVVE